VWADEGYLSLPYQIRLTLERQEKRDHDTVATAATALKTDLLSAYRIGTSTVRAVLESARVPATEALIIAVLADADNTVTALQRVFNHARPSAIDPNIIPLLGDSESQLPDRTTFKATVLSALLQRLTPDYTHVFEAELRRIANVQADTGLAFHAVVEMSYMMGRDYEQKLQRSGTSSVGWRGEDRRAYQELLRTMLAENPRGKLSKHYAEQLVLRTASSTPLPIGIISTYVPVQ
jgi:hypothetical protein